MKQKKQKVRRIVLYAFVLIAMLAVYLPLPAARAADSLTSAKDTLSDSDLSATATHTVIFETGTVIPSGGYIDVELPSGFGDVATSSITCPTNTTASVPSPKTARCTATANLASSTSYTIVIANVTNPSSAGSQTIPIKTYNSSDTMLEHTDMMVAIIDDVVVTARVSSTLTFHIYGTATSTTINGVDTTGSSTATTLPFGTLTVNASSTLGQRLTVETNARDGYTVTVEQDHNLYSDTNADIDSFIDGSPATTTAQAWQSPSNTLDQENTYGHFGLTSQDSTLSGGDDFGTALYKGFDGTNPIEVMYHNGPSDGSTDDKGSTYVAYTVEIGSLQEAGDYTNTLTYICTPTF